MNQLSGVQLRLKAGERVRVVIPKFNLEHGTGQVYPNNGLGTVIPHIYEDGSVVTSFTKGTAWIRLDHPFTRTGLVEKPVRMEVMWIPTWLLQRVKQGTQSS